jgi:tetratricopeptide (TPR) repeat protein
LVQAHNNLGLPRAAQQLPDEALAYYQRALKVGPSHIRVLANLGNTYKDQSCLTEAITCYRKALIAFGPNKNL